MELHVQVEKPSSIVRKLTIKVPAAVVSNRYQRGLAEVQRTANLKGFRPGQAPIGIIKQFYGNDVRHRLYHNLIEESFREAVRKEKLAAVGSPTIEESAEHKTGAGEHDHELKEDQDFTFTATVEILPEVEVKGYTGISLSQEKVEVTPDAIEKVVTGLRDSRAELLPLAAARSAKKGDHVDMTFSGGILTDKGLDPKPGMSGTRMLEIGSDSLIPGFEEELVGMNAGETKTFKIPFPKDFYEADMAGKDAEFTVTINEIKEKKLPELTDEFAKEMGYEGVADLRTKATEYLTKEKTDAAQGKLRGDLLQAIIEKNSFDVPKALIESQARALAQEWAQDLKQRGLTDELIQQAIQSESENLKKRAEGQVRASLVLEAIAKKESIEMKAEDFDQEVTRVATQMKIDEAKVREFYSNDPGRREDLMFRLRQDRTVKFLLDKAKIK
jgi:trigger factor